MSVEAQRREIVAAWYKRLSLLVLLLLVLTPSVGHAADPLKIVDPKAITFFIDGQTRSSTQTLWISNEGDALTGTLTVSAFMKSSTPQTSAERPVCVSVAGSDCRDSVTKLRFALPARAVTTISVTIETKDDTLQYGEASLIVLFEQKPIVPNGDTSVTPEPVTLSSYTDVFIYPALRVRDILLVTVGVSIVTVAVAVVVLFKTKPEKTTLSLNEPLGEMTWGAQSWTAFLTSLVSAIGVDSDWRRFRWHQPHDLQSQRLRANDSLVQHPVFGASDPGGHHLSACGAAL